jgi:hypothetical protein
MRRSSVPASSLVSDAAGRPFSRAAGGCRRRRGPPVFYGVPPEITYEISRLTTYGCKTCGAQPTVHIMSREEYALYLLAHPGEACFYPREPLRGSLADKGGGWYRLLAVPGIGWMTVKRLVEAGVVECDRPLTGKGGEKPDYYSVGFRLAVEPDLGDLWVE